MSSGFRYYYQLLTANPITSTGSTDTVTFSLPKSLITWIAGLCFGTLFGLWLRRSSR
jgi:ABC-type sulfate transport system permease component